MASTDVFSQSVQICISNRKCGKIVIARGKKFPKNSIRTLLNAVKGKSYDVNVPVTSERFDADSYVVDMVSVQSAWDDVKGILNTLGLANLFEFNTKAVIRLNSVYSLDRALKTSMGIWVDYPVQHPVFVRFTKGCDLPVKIEIGRVLSATHSLRQVEQSVKGIGGTYNFTSSDYCDLIHDFDVFTVYKPNTKLLKFLQGIDVVNIVPKIYEPSVNISPTFQGPLKLCGSYEWKLDL